MEYNKKLYEAIERVAVKNKTLKQELETITSDFKKIKEINIQLKKTTKIAEAFAKYKQKIDAGIVAEELLNTEKDLELVELAQMDLDDAKASIPVI